MERGFRGIFYLKNFLDRVSTKSFVKESFSRIFA